MAYILLHGKFEGGLPILILRNRAPLYKKLKTDLSGFKTKLISFAKKDGPSPIKSVTFYWTKIFS
jgi:hypothetical protein